MESSCYIRFCLHFHRMWEKGQLLINCWKFPVLSGHKKLWISILKQRSSVQWIKSVETPLLLAVIVILISSCGDRYKMLVFTVEYKENETHMQTLCCFGLATYQWSGRTLGYEHGNVPRDEKLILFLGCYVQQWLENQNVRIDTRNINKNRRRINNAVEGWNCRLYSITGRQQPGVFLQV
jgi:hypothetical protein